MGSLLDKILDDKDGKSFEAIPGEVEFIPPPSIEVVQPPQLG